MTDYCTKVEGDYSPVDCHVTNHEPKVEIHHYGGALPDVGSVEPLWLWVALGLIVAGITIFVWTLRRNNGNGNAEPVDLDFIEAALLAGRQRRETPTEGEKS